MPNASSKKALLAAGGTGGHMFPAQSLSEILSDAGWDIAMITDERGFKHTGRIKADPIIQVKAASLSPRNPIKAVSGVMKLQKGTRQAREFIKDWQPNIVVGFGGYPSFPAMREAQGMGLPTVIHEQNAVLGRVNRVFAKRASHLATGFQTIEKCPPQAKHVCTGNPLRHQILDAAPKSYAAPTDKINILIVGGSLGARIISQIMPQAIAALPAGLRARLNVVQQTLKSSLDTARATYESAGIQAVCEPFFTDIETYLSEAHYIIGRAGAGSVSEIALMGKPSLLVPLAIAMDDHQTENAKTLSRLNAADILPESEFTAKGVKTILERRLNDSHWLENAANAARSAAYPNAAKDLAELVISAAT